MPKIVLTAAFLALLPVAAFAQTKIEINTRLIGYDLRQAGQESDNTVLPRIVVKSGSEGIVNLSKEYSYPKEFNEKGKAISNRTVYLGVRAPFFVRENEGVVTYLARVALCERADPNEPSSLVLQTTTSFQGQLPFDKTVSVEVGAPGGRKARLEITMTRH